MNKNKVVVTIAVLTIISGLYLVSREYLISKKNTAYDNIGFKIYDSDILNKLDNLDDAGDSDEVDDTSSESSSSGKNNDDSKQESSNKKTKKSEKNNYIGTLEISKINLKKGFVDPKSKYNDISYNVTILESDFPDVKNGNFILVAHSGTGPQSFFKNLYKLKIGDTALVTYKNTKYTYKITKIYYQKKLGYLTVYRNINKTTLTLITCTKDNKKSQTVYIAELI